MTVVSPSLVTLEFPRGGREFVSSKNKQKKKPPTKPLASPQGPPTLRPFFPHDVLSTELGAKPPQKECSFSRRDGRSIFDFSEASVSPAVVTYPTKYKEAELWPPYSFRQRIHRDQLVQKHLAGNSACNG